VTLRAQVLDALGAVYDPELDEPITALGFVAACDADEASGAVDVRLRLPTPQCAPNFAFLMASDARAAALSVPAVAAAHVTLIDHYTGAEINAAVDDDGGLDDAFPGETDGDLAALRELFQRKALLARQARVYEQLRAAGLDAREIAGLRAAELPASAEAARCLELRCALGIAADPASPALVAGDGQPIAAAELGVWLRRARLVALSLDSNGALCRSLLRVRYGVEDPAEQEVAT
jgi:metal-sulfur cluster biosynthetic enzyme